MLAFEITINGEAAGTFGFEDWAVLLAHLRAFRSEADSETTIDDLRFAITGIAAGSGSIRKEHVDMFQKALGVGDVLQVKILETDLVAPPPRRYAVETVYTEEELLESERAEYRRLKAKFEPGP